MTIKIYGTATSPYVRLVALVAAQASVTYEFVTLAHGEGKTAAHREKHPFAQLPYMVCSFLVFGLFCDR